jgi:hypothetical protein
MKKLRYVGWASAGVAVVILIIAFISIITGIKILPAAHGASYFVMANSFFLLAITVFIATKQCCCDKCDCKDEKKES